jgi:hypothetical protein
MRRWLEFLNTPTQSINPVLCAFEGNKSQIPTLDEFKDEYRQSCEKTGAYFRRTEIVRHRDDDFLQLYQNVVDLLLAKDATDGCVSPRLPCQGLK